MSTPGFLFPGIGGSAQPLGGGGTGEEYIYMKSAAARVAGDVVKVQSSSAGLVDASQADDTNIYFVAVATKTMASGDAGWYQIKGRCTITTPSITTTAGHGLLMLNGAIADSSTTAQQPTGAVTNTDFAVVMTAATSSVSQDVYLYGLPITGTT